MNNPEDENYAARTGFIEQARNKELAKSLAILQEKVVTRLLRLSEHNPERFQRLNAEIYEGQMLAMVHGTFQGIKEVGFGITHMLEGRKTYKNKTGVNTQTMVRLGVYTDRETWEAVRQHEAYDWESKFGLTLDEVKEQVAGTLTEEEMDDATFPGVASLDDCCTYYFVDGDGNFAKVVDIPDYMADGRKDIRIEGHRINGTVSVQVPMMARDFVLMKTVLETMRKKIR